MVARPRSRNPDVGIGAGRGKKRDPPKGGHSWRRTGGETVVVGVLQVELSIPGADSLKAKRMVLRSVTDRIRKNFNVSVAEV